LERKSRGLVKEVVIAHRNRLCQFAFYRTKIVVFSEDNSTDEWKLSPDILAITKVFIYRSQGKRSARYRLKRKRGKKQKTREESTNNTTSQKNEEGRLDTITKNTNVSQFLSKDLASTVDGLRSIGLQYGSGQLPFAS
jgi:hypothetical protein